MSRRHQRWVSPRRSGSRDQSAAEHDDAAAALESLGRELSDINGPDGASVH